MKKKFLSILLALTLCLTLLPTAAMAEGESSTTKEIKMVNGTLTMDGSKWDTTGNPNSYYALSVGNYKLASDVTIDTYIQINGAVTLDLNGHVLKYSNSDDHNNVIRVGKSSNPGNFTLTDSGNTTHYFTVGNDGLWVYYGESKPTSVEYKSVTGGVITGGEASGVLVAPGATFTMNGGNIVGCAAGGGNNGGGVDMNGTFTMNGGSIQGCTTDSYGGGVYVVGIGDNLKGTFNMNGGSITDCTSTDFGGGVYVGPTAKLAMGSDVVTIKDNRRQKYGTTNDDNVYLDYRVDSENGTEYAATITVTRGLNANSVIMVTDKKNNVYNKNYLGDLDLSGASTDISGGGYAWDASEKTLTLTNAYFSGDLKLPDQDVTITIKGDVVVGGNIGDSSFAKALTIKGERDNEDDPTPTLTVQGAILCGTNTKALTFDGVTATVGYINWNHNSDGSNADLILKNSSTVKAVGATVNDSLQGVYAGAFDIQDSSKLVLAGAPISSNVESSITALNNYTSAGNKYTAKSTDSDGSNPTRYLFENDILVTRLTLQKYCTVTFNANGGTLASGTKTPQRVTYGTKITQPADPTSDGFAFSGWTATNNDGSTVDFTFGSTQVTQNLTFAAQWELIPTTYTVTYAPAAGGSSDEVTDTKTHDVDLTLKGAIFTRDGYTQTGWKTVSGETYALGGTYTANVGVTLYPVWTQNSTTPSGTGNASGATYYTITATAGTGGSVSPSGAVSVRRGSDRTFTVTPGAGYAVSDVLVDGQSVGAVTSYTFENVKTNHTIKAVFAADSGTILPNGLNHEDHVAYIQGFADGLFRPNAPITRAQTAVMLYRLLTPERLAEIETDAHSFSDVTADDWYSHEVATMANGGYITGYSDGTFGGDRSITRAEFVTILTRFIGRLDANCDFTDVPESHWAYDAIATATQAGWIAGYADGTFRPDQTITRAQVVTIINRALDRGVDADTITLAFNSFPDNPAGAWHYDDVIEAANGHNYTGHRPSENWTRLK